MNEVGKILGDAFLEAIRQALLQMRENVINQALLEAKRIRSTAEEEVRDRVTESEITKAARKQSEETIEEAQRKAQRILDETDTQANARRAGADQYAQATLLKLEQELAKVIDTVHNGIEVMDAVREPPRDHQRPQKKRTGPKDPSFSNPGGDTAKISSTSPRGRRRPSCLRRPAPCSPELRRSGRSRRPGRRGTA